MKKLPSFWPKTICSQFGASTHGSHENARTRVGLSSCQVGQPTGGFATADHTGSSPPPALVVLPLKTELEDVPEVVVTTRAGPEADT